MSAAKAARFARGVLIRCFNNLVKDRLALGEVEGIGWAQLCVLGDTGFSVVFSSGGRRLPEAVLWGLSLSLSSWWVKGNLNKRLPRAFCGHCGFWQFDGTQSVQKRASCVGHDSWTEASQLG